MKKIFVMMTAAFAVCALSACGGSSGSVYTSQIIPEDYVSVCSYDEIPISLAPYEVSEDDALIYVSQYLESAPYYSEIERDTVEEGDWVNIDYTIYYENGEEIEYAGNTSFNVEIGSGTLMDGIEEGLIGQKSGDTVTINVTFPDDYAFEDAAGEKGYWEVKINAIQEYITFDNDDDAAASLGIEGVESYDDLYNYVYDSLKEQLDEEYLSDSEEYAAEVVVDGSTLLDMPDAMYAYYYEDMYDYYTEYAEYYEMDFDEFMLEYVGTENAEGYLAEEAEEYVKTLLVFQYIANAEGLNPTDEEFDELCEEYAEYYGFESAEEMLEYVDEEMLRQDCMIDSVYEYLGEHAVYIGEE